MGAGRCAGCGYENASAKRVAAHVGECASFAGLYQAHPERALSPEAEHARAHSEAAQAAGRERVEAERVAERTRLLAASTARQAATRERYAQATSFAARHVAMPSDGTLHPRGATEAQRALSAELTSS